MTSPGTLYQDAPKIQNQQIHEGQGRQPYDELKCWKNLLAYFRKFSLRYLSAALEFSGSGTPHIQFYVSFKRPKTSILLTGSKKKNSLHPGLTLIVPRCNDVASAIGYTAKGTRHKRDDKDPDDDDLYTKTYLDDSCPNWHEIGDRPNKHGGKLIKRVPVVVKRVVTRVPETPAEAAVRHAASEAYYAKQTADRHAKYGLSKFEIDYEAHKLEARAKRAARNTLNTTTAILKVFPMSVGKFTRKSSTATRQKAASGKRVARARKTPMRRKASVATNGFAARVKKVIMQTAEQKMTFPVSLVFDEPNFGEPKCSKDREWNATIISGNITVQRACILLWCLTGTSSAVQICLGVSKVAPRVQATFAPTSENLISLYPYSQTANGSEYVRMTERVIGKMDPNFKKVIWNKAVPRYPDNTNLGFGRGGVAVLPLAVADGIGAIEYYAQCCRRTKMAFSIKLNKDIYEHNPNANVSDERNQNLRHPIWS
ncbi:hypothetical protein T492DRAFT_832038 [Pavlovales sp. CCMP2436]|nr:hypothetical protein T492DRAFT_832038 [Pavlovales sp. CCMP2436]